jgi:hypothetical protein
LSASPTLKPSAVLTATMPVSLSSVTVTPLTAETPLVETA